MKKRERGLALILSLTRGSMGDIMQLNTVTRQAMTKKDKLKAKLQGDISTFVFSDLVTLLSQFGYEMHERAGSRVIFIHVDDDSDRIHLHKPHPENTIKGGALKAVKAYLSEKGYFDEPQTEQSTNQN